MLFLNVLTILYNAHMYEAAHQGIKKYTLLFFLISCAVFLFSFPAQASAVACSCTGSVNGLAVVGCTIPTTTIKLPMDKSVSIDDIRARLNFDDCGAVDAFLPQILGQFAGGRDRADVTEAVCNDFANLNQSIAFNDITVRCSVVGDAPDFAGGALVGFTPALAPAARAAPAAGVAPAARAVPAPARPGAIQLVNPLGGTQLKPQGISLEKDPIAVIYGRIIKALLGIMGSITLLVFVYGGLLWLISAGNQEQVKKGSQTMLWAAVGIFVIFASYAILTLVINSLLGT